MEKTLETGSNARLSARLRLPPIEGPRVGLRVSDKTSGAKRSIGLERRRWL